MEVKQFTLQVRVEDDAAKEAVKVSMRAIGRVLAQHGHVVAFYSDDFFLGRETILLEEKEKE